jgi:ABC-2 type transport system permease protein
VGSESVGEFAGIFSPYTLVNGVQVFLFDSPAATATPPSTDAMGVLYLVATVLTIVGSSIAMLLRYRRVTG